jgi:hypothetical protein
LESKSQDQNSSRKTTTTEKDCNEFENHNNKVANVLENKAGSFPLSLFFSALSPRAAEEERKKRKGKTHVSSSTREREREREKERRSVISGGGASAAFFLLAKFRQKAKFKKSSDFGVFQ